MGQAVLWIEGLPRAASDAAEAFYQAWLPRARDAWRSDDALAMVFPAAAYDHRAWRLAAVRNLAREAAPKRVNAVAGDDPDALAAAIDWLARAPGITGQLLAVDGKAAEKG